MLQRMRDSAQGWIAWTIIGILIISLTLWGVSMYFTGEGSAQIDAAKINGTLITQQQVNSSYRLMRDQMGDQSVDEKQLRAQALQQLTNRIILADAAKDVGFNMSDIQLNRIISQDPTFQIDGRFSSERFQAILNQLSFTLKTFMQTLRAEMITRQFQAGLLATGFALRDEADQAYKFLHQTRDFRVLTIPYQTFLDQVAVTEAQIKQYYQRHKDDYRLPERMRISYIEATIDQLKQAIKPTESELQAFYQNNLENYTTPARWKVGHILIADGKTADVTNKKLKTVETALKAGQSFAKIAKKYSDDPLSAKKGGAIGWINPGSLNPQLEMLVSKLELGGVSKPVKTQNGYELAKLVAKQAVKTLPFKQVETQLRQAYIQQKANKEFADVVDQMTNMSFETPDSLQAIAKKLDLTVKTTDWFDLTGEKRGILHNPVVLQAAFDDNVRHGNNSEVIKPTPDTAIMLRQNAYQAARTQSLEQVKEQVSEAVRRQLAIVKAQQLAKTIEEKLEQKVSITDTLQQYQLTWKSYQGIGYHDKKMDQQIVKAVYSMAAPANGKVGISTIELKSGDYVVMALDKVTLGKKPDASQRMDVEKQLSMDIATTAFAELEDYYQKCASVKLFEQNP